MREFPGRAQRRAAESACSVADVRREPYNRQTGRLLRRQPGAGANGRLPFTRLSFTRRRRKLHAKSERTTEVSRREQLTQMLQSDADDVFLNYALAMAMLAEGDDEAGLRQMDRVIELDPNYVAAHFQKGQALARAGNLDDARSALQRGILVARKVGDTHAEGEMTGFLESL